MDKRILFKIKVPAYITIDLRVMLLYKNIKAIDHQFHFIAHLYYTNRDFCINRNDNYTIDRVYNLFKDLVIRLFIYHHYRILAISEKLSDSKERIIKLREG